ncbi:hypothetical protein BJ508DRAFT_307596 [Ascobolus immersus RN42]|uniref:Uncharacterized protein n=1 Tax=Ascobolus immersus RN42 TaxID=1160509 RepID=A0A3N4IER1_ASCIM|nr:hypothetical protein BJ508DRAFT_307596 [Ascobolus immersus RN42]
MSGPINGGHARSCNSVDVNPYGFDPSIVPGHELKSSSLSTTPVTSNFFFDILLEIVLQDVYCERIIRAGQQQILRLMRDSSVPPRHDSLEGLVRWIWLIILIHNRDNLYVIRRRLLMEKCHIGICLILNSKSGKVLNEHLAILASASPEYCTVACERLRFYFNPCPLDAHL